jgi:RNA polymerase II subunit A small phosphatase-like protein
MPTKLLVLDLDETLIYSTEHNLARAADLRVGAYYVYRRPHLADFIGVCFEHFDVAVWTSSSELYARQIVSGIFPAPGALKFVWSVNRCTPRYDAQAWSYHWVKRLGKVKRHGYRLEEVVVVDDTPQKHIHNYGNLVTVKEYRGDLRDSELRLLARYLVRLAEAPNIRAIEKRYWRSEVTNA